MMKINDYQPVTSCRDEQETTLNKMLELQPKQRPCPGCALKCSKCGGLTCTCICSMNCPEAPRMLSSDPDKFPIEDGIVPLVYTMRETRLAEPNWSCEGHLSPQGKLWKLPRVWFYVHHLVCADLLAHYLRDLRFKKLIDCDWRISLIARDNERDTTFSMEPSVDWENEHASRQPEAGLNALQRDARTIASHLKSGVRTLAQARLKRLF